MRAKTKVAHRHREPMKAALPKLIGKWEPILGVRVKRVVVREMKTAWGKCDLRTGTIYISPKLAKKPRACLDLVVLHEMTHLLEPTHNARFVALMNKFMPKWRVHEETLQGQLDVHRLREQFPRDRITRLTKTRSAPDIRHEVRWRGHACGIIIYKVRNVAPRSRGFKQMRRSLGVFEASLAVLVSTAFPPNHKGIAYTRGVLTVRPDLVVDMIRLLRKNIIERGRGNE